MGYNLPVSMVFLNFFASAVCFLQFIRQVHRIRRNGLFSSFCPVSFRGPLYTSTNVSYLYHPDRVNTISE